MSNREVYMDHVRQNFWKEMVSKEAHLRQEWHLKYSKNFIKTDEAKEAAARAGAPRRRRTGVVPRPNSAVHKMRALVSAEEARLTERRSPRGSSAGMDGSASWNSTGKSKSDSAASASSGLLEPMRPATRTTRDILYNGLSHDGEGRYKYLTARKAANPEDRFVYPLTNTQEYGWRIQDSMEKFKPSEFGRGAIVRDSFYRHGGVF